MKPATTRKVLIDCDPGIDDAVALVLALGSPEIDVLGVTTVSGNRDLETVTDNARRLLEFLGRPDVPVVRGAARPLQRDPVRASSHGATGLGGHRLPEAARPPLEGAACDYIAQCIRAHDPGAITLIAIGPLTNLALAIQRDPEIVGRVREVVVMGGAVGNGNMTPSAEFNFFSDAEAAEIVLDAPWRVTLLDLELTWQSSVTDEVVEQLSARTSPLGRALTDWITHYGQLEETPGASGPSLHDACAVAYVVDPTLVTTEPAFVAVETQGRWTYGRSVLDRAGIFGREPNVQLGRTLDRERFWARVLGAVRQLEEETQHGQA